MANQCIKGRCRGALVLQPETTDTVRDHGRKVLIHDVKIHVCVDCGERYVSYDKIGQLTDLLEADRSIVEAAMIDGDWKKVR